MNAEYCDHLVRKTSTSWSDSSDNAMFRFHPPFEGRKIILLLYKKSVMFHERFEHKASKNWLQKRVQTPEVLEKYCKNWCLEALEKPRPGNGRDFYVLVLFLLRFFSFLRHTDRQQEREPDLLGHMWFRSRAGGCFGGRAGALTIKTSCPGFPLEKRTCCENTGKEVITTPSSLLRKNKTYMRVNNMQERSIKH